jgi:hypothetical protein
MGWGTVHVRGALCSRPILHHRLVHTPVTDNQLTNQSSQPTNHQPTTNERTNKTNKITQIIAHPRIMARVREELEALDLNDPAHMTPAGLASRYMCVFVCLRVLYKLESFAHELQ